MLSNFVSSAKSFPLQEKNQVPFEVEVESKVVPWILGGNDGLLNKVEQGSNATCGWCDKICVQKG